MINLRVVAASSAMFATLMLAGPSLSNELTPGSHPPAEWEFRLTPYAWLLNLNGDVTARGITSDVDVTFGDLVDKSDSLMAFTGLIEARRGRFSLFADVVWVSRITVIDGAGATSSDGRGEQ
jgi:hypothetical protein